MVAFIALLVIVAANVIAPAVKVSYGVSGYTLTLDGFDVGPLHSLAGCRPVADIVTASSGPDAAPQKRVSSLRYEPCVLVFGGTMGAPLYKWIEDAFARKASTKSLLLTPVTFDGKPQPGLELRNAVIAAVKLPELDASSKSPALITLEVHPELVKASAASGSSKSGTGAKSKAWIPSTFRVEMDNATLPGVSRMSGVGMRMTFSEDTVGTVREPTKTPAKMSVDDVSLTIAASKASGLTSWADDLLVKGTGQERTFRVSYLTQNMQSTLFEVTLKGVGIFGGDIFLPATQEGSAERVARSTYLLYAEEATFAQAGGGAIQ